MKPTGEVVYWLYLGQGKPLLDAELLAVQNAVDNHFSLPDELQKVWDGNCPFWVASGQQKSFRHC